MSIQRNEQGLIVHGGHVVPWVTRWSGEVLPEGLGMTAAGDVVYPDEAEGEREADGVLWIREGLTRAGVPQWSEVNIVRQRASMRRAICQVCGKGIHQEVINWLVPRRLFEPEMATTSSPPVCDGCIPVSLALCPHLQLGDWVVVRTLDYALYGVFGQYWERDPQSQAIEHKYVEAPYRRTSRKQFAKMVAQGQLVQFTKYIVGGVGDLPESVREVVDSKR